MQNTSAAQPTDVHRDARFMADPHADRAVASIVGPDAGNGPDWQKLATVTALFRDWRTNEDVLHWQAPATLDPDVAAAIHEYLRVAQSLPAWADREKLERAEKLFIDYGVLSVTLLFCSSLPECYVLPDLSAVLDQSGQLEAHTEYRIRSTGAMIFPVMMAGGLTAPAGGGIAQVLKVRLIHATIRHLILRGTPEGASQPANACLPPLAEYANAGSMHQRMYGMGWDVGLRGLPCNQEELAYTLLTFNYVFLRSLRKLGLAFSAEDEVAYLHCWNVAGHFLGIDRSLMADTYLEAEARFNAMQAAGRARFAARPHVAPDARVRLGEALMNAMESVVPAGIAKPFPTLLTRYLCGPATACDLGIDAHLGLPSRIAFALMMMLIRAIDTLGRIFSPGFALSRVLTRVVGQRLMAALLMSQTRSLALPTHLLSQAGTLSAAWAQDSHAPRWQQRLEGTLAGWLYGRPGAAKS
jgi:hypothetical protein